MFVADGGDGLAPFGGIITGAPGEMRFDENLVIRGGHMKQGT
jgi:hypothetical protein